MKTLLAIFGAVASLFCTSVVAEPTGMVWPAIACGNPCVISDDAGGIVDTYEAQARLMAATNIPVIVDGPCMSACTIFVDIDRANICLTERALLGYHKSVYKKGDDDVFGDIEYSTPGLEDYIKSHGGLPDPDSGHLLMLNSHEAGQFYKACS
jgi:hypothetical protein